MPVGSGGVSTAFAMGLSPTPIGPFPPPAHRTGRADFPHPALQQDHAARTRNARSVPLPAIAGHSRYRRALPPASRSCTASSAVPLSDARPVHALTAPCLPSVSPVPSLMHVMLRNSLPLHAGLVGKATPAGLRSSVIPPRLRPLSSTGVTPRPQSYRPLRHPAGPACPSRGSGCRVHGSSRASRVATSLIFHACQCQYPDGNNPVRASLASQVVGGLPLGYERVGFRIARLEACSAFTRVPACMVAESPKVILLPKCFNPCRHLHEPLWSLPTGATGVGRDSHPQEKNAFPRRTQPSRWPRASWH